MNEKDNIELYDEIERDLQDKLMRMDPGDPNRKPLMDELKGVSSIIISYRDAEQRRLDSYAKNENDEAKIAIEHQRYESDKKRGWISLIISAMTPIVGGGIGYWINKKSYQMEEKEYAYKPLKDFGKRLTEFNIFKR